MLDFMIIGNTENREESVEYYSFQDAETLRNGIKEV